MKPTGSTLAVIGLLSLVAVSLAKADEPSAVYQSLLAKYDVNKDGRLDVAEREVIRTDRLKPNPRGRSERRRFRYPDPIVARFDKDGDDELNEEEFDAARNWVDKRFKEINDQYDVNKDGRLGTDERASLSKQCARATADDVVALPKKLRCAGHVSLLPVRDDHGCPLWPGPAAPRRASSLRHLVPALA